MGEAPAFTPVHLLTGFLGSGKTTLLRRWLASPDLADTAVLINEFGEVGLDHDLVERVDADIVLLSSGCLCCTLRGDLAEAVKSLHSRRERGLVPLYRRLVIESSGLADPLPILATIAADPQLRHHYRVGRVVATIDAVNGSAQLDRQPESRKQAALADRLVVTKTDIADPDVTRALVARLTRLHPDAPIRFATDPTLTPEDLIGGETGSWFRAEAAEPDAPHGDDISSISFILDRPVDWTAFGLWLSMLLNRHGEAVLRVKAILAVEGESAPVVVHAVQQLVHAPAHLARWPSADRRSRLVFIVQGIDAALLRRSFDAFVGGSVA